MTCGTKRTRTRYKFTHEDFVTAWQTSNLTQEVADKLSAISGQRVPKHIVLSRACVYRKAGVKLKVIPPPPRKPAVDVKELKSLAAASASPTPPEAA